jgi:hypothetical protein
VNPEFERNLWLEAAPRRLGGVAVVLALIYGAAIALAKGDAAAMAQGVGIVGALVFVASGLLWGAWAAGGSVLDEIRGRTWDFQRLSALTPWAMTWGKLFGAGSLAWIAAATGLIAAGAGLSVIKGPVLAAEIVVGLIGLAVFLQACAMGAALIGVRKARAEGRVATGGAVILGVLGGILLLSLFSKGLPLGSLTVSGGASLGLSDDRPVFWFGLIFPSVAFTAASLCAFAAWALVGAWRLMRLELQMHNSPYVWVAFLLFAGLWRAGLAPALGGVSAEAITAGLVFVAAAYVCAFVEPADAVKVRRFWAALRGGALMKAADLAPAAVFAVKLAVLAVIAYAVLPAPSSLSSAALPAPMAAIAALAFMARDLGVIILFRFGPRPGRGDLTAVIALALLYWIGALIGRLSGGEIGQALFSPFVPDQALVSAFSGAAQAALAWILAARRLRGPKTEVGRI